VTGYLVERCTGAAALLRANSHADWHNFQHMGLTDFQVLSYRCAPTTLPQPEPTTPARPRQHSCSAGIHTAQQRPAKLTATEASPPQKSVAD